MEAIERWKERGFQPATKKGIIYNNLTFLETLKELRLQDNN